MKINNLLFRIGENKEFMDFIQNAISSIIYSLIAALIFWLVFNFLPDSFRRKKIRPKIEFDIYEFYNQLFAYIQLALLHQKHSPSFLQHDIYAGNIKKEDFELWLQNKCLNESYRYGEFAPNYLTIGKELEEYTLDLCKKADQIYAFIPFLSAKEILLIKKITVKLRVYSYSRSAEVCIKGIVFKDQNPNLAYMSTNFFEIYNLFIKLQKNVYAFKYIDTSINNVGTWDFNWNDTYYSYFRGEYQKCLRKFFIAQLKNKFPEYLWGIRFLCMYHTGKISKALTYLKTHLATEKLQLIYIRDTFKEVYNQEDIKRVLIKDRSEKEYNDMVACIEQEEKIKNDILEQAHKIKKLYDSSQNSK